jgi:hypothetical protein
LWLSRILADSTAKPASAWPVVLFPRWYVQQMDDTTRQKGWRITVAEILGWLP